jgi:hypothetical protein
MAAKKAPSGQNKEGALPIKSPADPRLRRRLLLKFINVETPVLDRIEFYYQADAPAYYTQQGDSQCGFAPSNVYHALGLLFVETCAAARDGQPGPYFLSGERTGSLAASLGNAIYADGHSLNNVFAEPKPSSPGTISRLKQVFGGKNVGGKEKGERRICIRSDFLLPDTIQIYWDAIGRAPLKKNGEFRLLIDRIRKSLDVPAPELLKIDEEVTHPSQLTFLSQTQAEGSLPDLPELFENKEDILRAMADGGTPEEITLWLKSNGVVTVESRVRAFCRAVSALGLAKPFVNVATQTAAVKPEVSREPDSMGDSKGPSPAKAPDDASQPDASKDQAKEPTPEPRDQSSKPSPTHPEEPLAPKISPIPPGLFCVYSKGHAWDDNDPLINFGKGEDEIWRLKDAFEGVLILGAPGSGKTSGSGNTFAESFVRAGFGGLVLTAKAGEAQRWQRLCERCGRGGEVFVVDGHNFPLNFLAHESQRPGGEFGLAENLVKLFRVLVDAVSSNSDKMANEDIWIKATNQLMRSLFEVFILAKETLTIDRMNKFLAMAPQAAMKDPENDWRRIPVFGNILERASQAQTPEDKRVFDGVYDYWTRVFPSYRDRMRNSIVLGFSGMADILAGRGIHELACGETKISPEVILSGYIVILDLPIKEYGQGGLLIQAAWKHLFQMAVERRTVVDSDAYRYPMFYIDEKQNSIIPLSVASGTGDRRCPVFLWEDEAQFFFAKHDIEFQATCRECRVAHVVISQNLHNFFHLGHNPHTVEGTFSLMNTQVFHANNDHYTNKWASDKIGKELRTRINFSTSMETPKTQGFWARFDTPESKSSRGTSSHTQWEEIVRPEEFHRLKKGGNGTCEAYLLWMSHSFQANGGKPFVRMAFNQA